MADEATIIPPEEVISEATGSVSTLGDAIPEAEEERKVPERDLLRLKDDRDKLKERVKELEKQQEKAKTSPDVESLSAKYQWVDQEFLADVALLIDKKAEEKIAPFRIKTQAEDGEKRLNALVDEQLALADGIDLDRVDKDLLKTVALSAKYRNTPISEIAKKLFPKLDKQGKSTTENDMRPATDLVSDVVDTDAPISKEKLARIFADPKARKAYFDKKYS